MNRKFVFWLSLIVAMLIVGCSGQPAASTTDTTSSTSNSTPADAVNAYFNAAMLGQGDPTTMICSTIAADVKAAMQTSMDTVKSAYATSKATLDLSGLTFTTKNESGDTADVDVAGTLKITVNGKTSEAPYPSATIKMKNENGWKICG